MDGDGIGELARALKARIEWDVETGVAGYPRETATAAPLRPRPPAPAPAGGEGERHEAGDPAAELAALREELGDCTRCPLHSGRTKLVFGEGSPRARLVFVGEGPGRDEDLSGRPFVGAAGRLLDKIIAAIGLRREDVYICNVVKCRPPNNRDPEPDEAATCGPFMRRQLGIIRPEVVVALGKPAARFLLGTEAPIGQLRGRFHDLDGMRLMPTYHPAYLLRNAAGKRPVWEDMKQVRDLLGLCPAGEKEGR
jgi:DNA polymerase